jgi:hypothetical protein
MILMWMTCAYILVTPVVILSLVDLLRCSGRYVVYYCLNFNFLLYVKYILHASIF